MNKNVKNAEAMLSITKADLTAAVYKVLRDRPASGTSTSNVAYHAYRALVPGCRPYDDVHDYQYQRMLSRVRRICHASGTISRIPNKVGDGRDALWAIVTQADVEREAERKRKIQESRDMIAGLNNRLRLLGSQLRVEGGSRTARLAGPTDEIERMLQQAEHFARLEAYAMGKKPSSCGCPVSDEPWPEPSDS